MLKLSGYPRLTWGRLEGAPVGVHRWATRVFQASPPTARTTGHRVIDDHRMSRQTKPGTHFWANRAASVREANIRPTPPAGKTPEWSGGDDA